MGKLYAQRIGALQEAALEGLFSKEALQRAAEFLEAEIQSEAPPPSDASLSLYSREALLRPCVENSQRTKGLSCLPSTADTRSFARLLRTQTLAAQLAGPRFSRRVRGKASDLRVSDESKTGGSKRKQTRKDSALRLRQKRPLSEAFLSSAFCAA